MEGNSGLLHSFLTPVQPFCSPSPRPQNRCVRSGCAGEGAQRLLLFDFIFFLNIDGGGGEVSKPRQRCAVRTGRFPPRRPVKTRGGGPSTPALLCGSPPGSPPLPRSFCARSPGAGAPLGSGSSRLAHPNRTAGVWLSKAPRCSALLRAPPRTPRRSALPAPRRLVRVCGEGDTQTSRRILLLELRTLPTPLTRGKALIPALTRGARNGGRSVRGGAREWRWRRERSARRTRRALRWRGAGAELGARPQVEAAAAEPGGRGHTSARGGAGRAARPPGGAAGGAMTGGTAGEGEQREREAAPQPWGQRGDPEPGGDDSLTFLVFFFVFIYFSFFFFLFRWCHCGKGVPSL